jgi:hypothetical protein
MIVVVAIVAIGSIIAVLVLTPAMANAHVNSAVQITLNELRKARQESMDRRMQYDVTFTLPRTITTVRWLAGFPTVERTTTLPQDIQFLALPGIPGAGQAPDQFGTGANAIDFGQATGGGGNTVSFLPDGTAQDAAGNPNDGVIYMARPGSLYSSRAVSLWGATGRLKAWSLRPAIGGGPVWGQ